MLKSKAISIIDNMILGCLIVYSLTFLIPMPINLLVTAFVLGLVKLFFVRPKIEIHTKHFYFLGLFIVCTMISVIFNENASFS